jgi:hypothetical protein
LPVDTLTNNNDQFDFDNEMVLEVPNYKEAFLGSILGPMIAGSLLDILGMLHSNINMTESTTPTTDDTLTGYAIVLSLSSFYFLCSAIKFTILKWLTHMYGIKMQFHICSRQLCKNIF